RRDVDIVVCRQKIARLLQSDPGVGVERAQQVAEVLVRRRGELELLAELIDVLVELLHVVERRRAATRRACQLVPEVPGNRKEVLLVGLDLVLIRRDGAKRQVSEP